MAFDAQAAKTAGYSDGEIADYLGQQSKFDVGAARKSGYSDAEIIDHLSTARPKPAAPGFIDQVKGAVGGAVDKLKADTSAAYQVATARASASPPNPLQAAAASVGDIRRTAGLIGDVGNVLASPFAGAMHAAVVRPVANAMDQIPMQAVQAPQLTMQGGAPSLTAPRRLSPTETHAANEQAVSTALMAAGPGRAAPIAAAARAPNAFAATVQRFDQAGVTPMLAANGGKGAATMTNVVAENPLAGGAVRSRLRNAVDQTAASASNIAGRYGETRGAQITGENVQAGVTRFAQDKNAPASFAAKADEKYTDVFGKLDAAMAGKTAPGRAQPVADDQFAHQAVIGGSQIETPATAATLDAISGGTQSKSIGDLIADPTLSKAAKALTNAQGAKDMSFNDLRRLRTWTRDAQKNPELRQNIGAANLQRLEGSLTQDIYANADKLGSPQLAQQLRRTDQFYAAGQQRIQSALDSFAAARSGEGAYSRVQQAAGSTSSADAQKLLSLKRSLAPDEWGDVAANTVSEMGRQGPGAAPAGGPGFSVSQFVTNYNKLSPRGRDILFGSVGGGGQRATDLRMALDNLASVADDLKGIEKGANTSKTFVNAQAAGTVAGLLNHVTAIPTAVGLGGMALTGEILTNPIAVRWLTRVGRAANNTNPTALQIVVKQLGNASRANAALAPVYQESLKLLAPPLQITSRSVAGTQDPQAAP